MRVFITGATGFIGSALVRELIREGHEVTGLARSEASARSLVAAGARAHRGSLEDVKSLLKGAEWADAVIHAGFYHTFSHASLGTRLRVLLGGSPRGIVFRFMRAAFQTDQRSIETFGSHLARKGGPLVTITGTMGLTPGRIGLEEDASDPTSFGGRRSRSEELMQSLALRGVRTSVVRLPPIVHGMGDSRTGFMPSLIATARTKGISAYVGDGMNRWPSVHRLDAVRLLRLALEGAPAGARLHGVADEGVPFREIAEVIGRHLSLPVTSITREEAPAHFGSLGPLVSIDNPVSSAKTRDRYDWQPLHPGIIPDLEEGHYFK